MAATTLGTPTIVLLNGSSSAGKTTLSIELEKLLRPHAPFVRVGIDSFLPSLPARLLRLPPDGPAAPFLARGGSDSDSHDAASPCHGFTWQRVSPCEVAVLVGPAGGDWFRYYYCALAALARAGNNLIVDDVFFPQDALRDELRLSIRSMLAPFRVLRVGVLAPPEVLEARERQRADRVPGQARGLAVCHKGLSYDLELDTSMEGAADLAQRVVQRLGAVEAARPVGSLPHIEDVSVDALALRAVEWTEDRLRVAQQAPSTELLHAYNFRSLGGLRTADGRTTKHGVLFRCGIPRCSADDPRVTHDLKLFRDHYGIRTILDLREAHDSGPLDAAAAQCGLVYRSVPLLVASTLRRCTEMLPESERLRLSAIEESAMPPAEKERLFFKELAGAALEQCRPGCFYRPMIAHSKKEIKRALEELSNPEALPAVICCSQGKDRTGLLTAMVLSIAGVQFEEVVLDFCLSLKDYTRHLDDLLRTVGIDPSCPPAPNSPKFKLFAACKEHAAVSTQVLQESLEAVLADGNCTFAGYCAHVGLAPSAMESLVHALTK